jgi:alkylated DNA repair dioxygenase AlkB
LTVRVDRASIEHVFFQGSLFGSLAPAFDARFADVERVDLDGTSWVDVCSSWLIGADAVFAELVERLAWRQRRGVPMYDQIVDEPRLTSWWDTNVGTAEPLEILADVRRALGEHYAIAFDSIGFNLYRDGDDSVAWHGDRHRHHVVEPIVAIVSVGSRRTLRLRPRGGGVSRGWDLGEGDLLVMGGRCQHDWEHSVPKVRHAVGPRMSITYRHDTRWRELATGTLERQVAGIGSA